MTGGRWRGRLLPLSIAGMLAASFLAAGQPGSANAQPLVAVYEAFWAGLPAARIRLELAGEGSRYQDAITIRTHGLPYLVTRFCGTATVEGSLGPAQPAEPLHYDAVYDLRKRRNRSISLRFVRRGGAIIAERGPSDTSRKRPIEEAYRRDAIDPLSVIERIREALRAAQHGGGNSFTIPVYDGARRFDVRGRLLPGSSDEGRSLRVVLSLRPIAGFKGGSSKDGDPEDAPRSARLVVSDDQRLLPMSFEVPIYYLPLVVRLAHLCPMTLRCPL
jgi:Protein of unknown function (DUF3108)